MAHAPSDGRAVTPAAWRFARFLVVGGLNTALGYGIYAGLLALGFDYRIATTVAFCLGLALGFRAHAAFVFGGIGRGFAAYAASWIAVYLAHLGALTLLVGAGVDAYLAGALMLAPTVLASFLVMKYIVFATAAPGARR